MWKTRRTFERTQSQLSDLSAREDTKTRQCVGRTKRERVVRPTEFAYPLAELYKLVRPKREESPVSIGRNGLPRCMS